MGRVEEKHYFKPKLGKTVYCIYNNGIFTDTVGYLGTDSFIVDSFNRCTNEDSWEWGFDLYNQLWFTSLSKAKRHLKERLEEEHDRKIKIVKVSEDYYEAEFGG